MKNQIKRITAVAAAALAIFFTFPAELGLANLGVGNIIMASAESSGDWEYTVNADQTVTITGYYGWGNSVEIPEFIDEIDVTSIGYAAFNYCTGLTSIYIPNGISIRQHAIPSTATKITYIVNSDGSVTITKIELLGGQDTIDIPAAIGRTSCFSNVRLVYCYRSGIRIISAYASDKQLCLIKMKAGFTDNTFSHYIYTRIMLQYYQQH